MKEGETMDEEFWQLWAQLRAVGRKDLARKFLRLGQEKEHLDRRMAKWVVKADAFSDEMKVETLKFEMEMWNREAER